MSAHIEGPVVCDWCGYHLYPVNASQGHFKHQHRPKLEGQLGPNCPHEGKFYQVDWSTGTVIEVK